MSLVLHEPVSPPPLYLGEQHDKVRPDVPGQANLVDASPGTRSTVASAGAPLSPGDLLAGTVAAAEQVDRTLWGVSELAETCHLALRADNHHMRSDPPWVPWRLRCTPALVESRF